MPLLAVCWPGELLLLLSRTGVTCSCMHHPQMCITNPPACPPSCQLDCFTERLHNTSVTAVPPTGYLLCHQVSCRVCSECLSLAYMLVTSPASKALALNPQNTTAGAGLLEVGCQA